MADSLPARSPSPVYVIGGGPGGLAAAAALRARGVRAVVLEKSDRVGASWRGHYDRLHLHTTRRLSALPGLPMPRAFGRWVGRDDVVRYLEKYAEHHELEIVTGVEVTRIDPAPDGSGWVLRATGGRRADSCGAARSSSPPATTTPRASRLAGPGHVHRRAAARRRVPQPGPYAGRDVLVVGVGNTGAEIAVDLVEGGASRVRLAVRTAPHIVRRSTAGWPAQAHRHPGPPAAGAAGGPGGAAVMARIAVPDLSAQGLPRPETGPLLAGAGGRDPGPGRRADRRGAERQGRAPWRPSSPSTRTRWSWPTAPASAPDAVIAATGYRRALEPLVGHLDVLDARGRPVTHGARTPKQAPGLYFTGFTNPISGMFREMALDAGKIASTVFRTTA